MGEVRKSVKGSRNAAGKNLRAMRRSLDRQRQRNGKNGDFSRSARADRRAGGKKNHSGGGEK